MNCERCISKLQNFNKQIGIKTTSHFRKIVVNHKLSFPTACFTCHTDKEIIKFVQCYVSICFKKIINFSRKNVHPVFFSLFFKDLPPPHSPYERDFFNDPLCTGLNTANIFDEVICFALFGSSLFLLITLSVFHILFQCFYC